MTTPNKTPPGADPKQLERTGTVREIGSQAVWSLSSCKPGKTKQKETVLTTESFLVHWTDFNIHFVQVCVCM